ncbi:Inhibitor of sigma-G Gin [Alteribacillus persepolensis]|uniref:Inhibitor of sigma-G Gin n=1 Tax=Alteribacillus persepolensis TaxID=568899 RepID=A0A1G8HXA1_9BACI|nr:sigma factor G inhibitor Gin [Alteribacillus persepolensis]SDI11192.1 Inhibitor of sigma-G Gin [Alteribacillus persepolensis]
MNNQKIQGERCVLCDQEKKEGIHILEAFLCKECERELVKLEPEHPTYAEKIKKLRKLKSQRLLS